MGGGSVLMCFFSSNDAREKMIHYIDNLSCEDVDEIILFSGPLIRINVRNTPERLMTQDLFKILSN